jgi:hypothetical protein
MGAWHGAPPGNPHAHQSDRKKSVTSYALVSSVRGATKSSSSWSLGLSIHDEMGRAFSGWKMYEAGELSMMSTLRSSRPRRLRS